MTGIALLFGYGLLGAGWLILKTEGDVQDASAPSGRVCLAGVLAAIGIVSIWTPFMSPAVAARWFSLAEHAVSGARADRDRSRRARDLARARQREPRYLPFAGAIGLFVLSYIGIAISLYPMIVPYHFTLWEAASSVANARPFCWSARWCCCR